MLASYSQGVRAVPELIGKAEDISRFDLVLLLGIDDVSIDIINQPVTPPKKMKYSGKDFNDLVMFAWTIKPDDITFTKKALAAIYKNSKALANKYDESIPLIVPSSQRMKLAKISVAVATMVFNYNGQLVVDEMHVDYAMEFLNRIYDKPICAYDEYSRLEKSRHKILNEEPVLNLIEKDHKVIDQLLDIDRFNHTDLQEIFDTGSRSDTRKIINTLVQEKAIKRSAAGGYEKTSAFIHFLRRHKNGAFKDKVKDQDQDQNHDDVAEFENEGGSIIELDDDFPF